MSIQQGDGYADVNGVRLHYRVVGQGPACIAHPGGPGSNGHYFSDLAGLSSFLTLIFLDPRGSQGSTAPSDPTAYELHHYATDVEGLREHLGLGPFVLLGHSHGGFVAQQYALDYPGRLSHLILANTAPTIAEETGERVITAVERRKNEPWYPEARAAFDSEWAGEYETPEDLSRLLAAELPFYFREWNEPAQRYAETWAHIPFNIDALKHFNEVQVRKIDLRPRLHEIQTPALVLTGEYDFICDTQSAREMATRIPNAELCILEGVGHFAFIDDPEQFRETIRRFVLG